MNKHQELATIVTLATSGMNLRIRGYSVGHGAARSAHQLKSEDERGRHQEVAMEVAKRAGWEDVTLVSARLPRSGWVHLVVPKGYEHAIGGRL